jgi:hypothetical protein
MTHLPWLDILMCILVLTYVALAGGWYYERDNSRRLRYDRDELLKTRENMYHSIRHLRDDNDYLSAQLKKLVFGSGSHVGGNPDLNHFQFIPLQDEAAEAADAIPDANGFYFCDKHSHEQTEPCPQCTEENNG